jgi:hypothetical protein
LQRQRQSIQYQVLRATPSSAIWTSAEYCERLATNFRLSWWWVCCSSCGWSSI